MNRKTDYKTTTKEPAFHSGKYDSSICDILIPKHSLVSVAEQACLSVNWSQTPNNIVSLRGLCSVL